jgi:hypothetical protein
MYRFIKKTTALFKVLHSWRIKFSAGRSPLSLYPIFHNASVDNKTNLTPKPSLYDQAADAFGM